MEKKMTKKSSGIFFGKKKKKKSDKNPGKFKKIELFERKKFGKKMFAKNRGKLSGKFF